MSYGADSAWIRAFGVPMDDVEAAYDSAYHASADRQADASGNGNTYDERQARRDALDMVFKLGVGDAKVLVLTQHDMGDWSEVTSIHGTTEGAKRAAEDLGVRGSWDESSGVLSVNREPGGWWEIREFEVQP